MQEANKTDAMVMRTIGTVPRPFSLPLFCSSIQATESLLHLQVFWPSPGKHNPGFPVNKLEKFELENLNHDKGRNHVSWLLQNVYSKLGIVSKTGTPIEIRSHLYRN
jgi:hypothetical protein